MTWFTTDLDPIHRPSPSTNTPHPGWWHAMADNFAALGTWTSDPDVTWDGSSSTPTLGNGTLRSDFLWLDSWLLLDLYLELGSTSSVSGTGDWTFSLPAGIEFAETNQVVGGGINSADGGSSQAQRALVAVSKTATTFEVFLADTDRTGDPPQGTNQSGANILIDGTGDAICVKLNCRTKPFDPLSAVAWHWAFWQYGPRQLAGGFADGDAVTTVYDEIGGQDWAEVTNPPSQVDYESAVNNRSVLRFGASDEIGEDWVTAPDYTNGVTWLLVINLEAVNTSTTILGATGAQSNTVEIVAGPQWRIWDGGASDAGTPTTGCHLISAFYPGSGGGNRKLKVDGTSLVDTAGAGDESTTSARFGVCDGLDVVFAGCFQGDLFGTTAESTFERWAAGLGATIA